MSAPSITSLPARHSAGHRLPVRYRCGKCGNVGTAAAFRAGRGRHYGEHPDFHYCAGCGGPMQEWTTDWQRVEVEA